MKKLLNLLAMCLMAVGANAQTVLAEADFTTASEFTGWIQFDDSQTDGKVELQAGVGLAITVGTQTGQLWQPQIMLLSDGSFDLEKDEDYIVVVTAKFPTAGTLQINMGSWSYNAQDAFSIGASNEFQTIECVFDDWSETIEGAHLLFHCGDFKGTTIVKKIQVIGKPSSEWTIAGDELLTGVDWDVTYYPNCMKHNSGENYTLIKKEVTLPKGTYYFKVFKDNATSESYPSNNASLVINEDATYTVTFSFNANTKELSATATKTDEAIYYNFIPKGKVAEVITKPKGYKGIITIPSSVTHEGEEYTVSKIADNAFANCGKLSSITIPNSVTSIGSSAFYNCSGLTSVTIGNNVTYIGESAFKNCVSLKSLIIPKSVTSIGNQAFYNCKGLTSIKVESGNQYYDSRNDCNALIETASNTLLVGSNNSTIPNSVSSIGSYAFYNCKGLKSINIPNNVSLIGSSAFYGCNGLTSITIPNSVTSIGTYAFYGCIGLSSVTLSSSLANIDNYTFQNCTGLTSLTIPNNVGSIGSYAFYGCTSLTSVTIPNSVMSIGSQSFYNCKGLKTVTLGSNLSSIYSSAFGLCEDLTDVYCYAGSVPSTATDVFNGSYIDYATTLHVPAASLNNYMNTDPWKKFQSKVAISNGEIPETPKCAKPEISFVNGKVSFSCATEGVEYISEVTLADTHKYYDSEIQLSQKYKVRVYATKANYINSDVTTREIVITGNGKAIVVGDVDGDGKVNAADHVKLSDIIMEK